ncbi:MAG: transposase [Sphingomonadales bacterium]|nr:transposase [Sphingomonadales bacterium]
MPLAIANPDCAPIGLDDFTVMIDRLPERSDGGIDPRDAAPALGALARNRDFLPQLILDELKRHCVGQVALNRYGAQVILIARRRGRYIVRANIWPARDDPEYRANGPDHYFYGRPHDHNFDFLTVGYLGPGYVSDYYDYGEGVDNRIITGHVGEAVPLRFIERSALGEGRMLLYRAGIDIHCQWPPASLSISLNVMDSGAPIRWRNQYTIDLDRRTVERNMAVAASECLLAVAVHYGGNGLDLAHDFAARHPSARMRWSAVQAIATSYADSGQRAAWYDRMAASDCALVAHECTRRLHRAECPTRADRTGS